MTEIEKDQLRLLLMYYQSHAENLTKIMEEYDTKSNTFYYIAGMREGYSDMAEQLYMCFPFLKEPDHNGYYYPQGDGAK